MSSSRRTSPAFRVAMAIAVSQDRDSVRNLENFLQAMRDIDDAHALRSQRSNDAEKALHFSIRQRSRGFVRDQDFRIGADRFRDFHDLLFRHAESAGQTLRVNFATGAVKQFLRTMLARLPIDSPPRPRGLQRPRDVLGHAQMREQGRLLVDGGDPERARHARIVVAEPPCRIQPSFPNRPRGLRS